MVELDRLVKTGLHNSGTREALAWRSAKDPAHPRRESTNSLLIEGPLYQRSPTTT
jgi:hypothetical protein